MSTVQDVITRARHQLNDEDAAGYRWSDPELIAYTTDGLRQTVRLKPEANVVEEVFALADSAIQTLPARATKFLRVTANYNNATESRGDGVRQAQKDVFDTFEPGWESAAGGPPYQHYMHDVRFPTVFYVYPRPSTGTHVLVQYAALPAEVAELEDDLPLSDQYLDAVVEYVLYRALTKEGRFSQVPDNKRQQLWQSYLQALGLSRQVAQSVTPEEFKP